MGTTDGSGEGQALVAKLDAFRRRYRLSRREGEVLGLLLSGVHPKAIGGELGCRYASVRTHLARMYRKSGCSGARELVLRFFASGDPRFFRPSL